VDCIQLAHDKFQTSALLNIVMILKFHKWWETFLTKTIHVNFSVALLHYIGDEGTKCMQMAYDRVQMWAV